MAGNWSDQDPENAATAGVDQRPSIKCDSRILELCPSLRWNSIIRPSGADVGGWSSDSPEVHGNLKIVDAGSVVFCAGAMPMAARLSSRKAEAQRPEFKRDAPMTARAEDSNAPQLTEFFSTNDNARRRNAIVTAQRCENSQLRWR